MPVAVFRAFSIVDGELVGGLLLPNRCNFREGDVVALLTDFNDRGAGDGPLWRVGLQIGSGETSRQILLDLKRFLTSEEYRESFREPFPFEKIRSDRNPDSKWLAGRHPDDAELRWLWLFRDAFYVTERSPKPSEQEEVILKIKRLHFERDEDLKRLREQVSNYEAIERTTQIGVGRRPIPDDVKMLVWSRDAAACIKCGSGQQLHFDHIIPLSRGGSDEAENIQLLCRTCNLTKSDRIA